MERDIVFIGAPGIGDDKVVLDLLSESQHKETIDTNVEFRDHRGAFYNEKIDIKTINYYNKNVSSEEIMAIFISELEKQKSKFGYKSKEGKEVSGDEVVEKIKKMAVTPLEDNTKCQLFDSVEFRNVGGGDSIERYTPFRLFETVMIEYLEKKGYFNGKNIRLSGSFGLYAENKNVLPERKYKLVLLTQDENTNSENVCNDVLKNLQYPLSDMTKGTDRRGRYETIAKEALAKERSDLLANKNNTLDFDSIKNEKDKDSIKGIVTKSVNAQIKKDRERNPIFRTNMGKRLEAEYVVGSEKLLHKVKADLFKKTPKPFVRKLIEFFESLCCGG